MRGLLVALLALVLTACSSSSPQETPPPVSRVLHISTAGQLNPYGGENSHPVVLRLYQLSEAGTFRNAEFLDLYKNDQQVLASTLVDTLYLDPMLPATDQQINIDVHFRSRYLAVFAEFSEYENAVSRALLKLDESNDDQEFKIEVTGLRVTLVTQPEKSWWQKL
ncbi:type VI secretion system lipoprotein TssJ [Aliamphritea ceti]|uniref:type VI secretion system lipoprotein TssJ n=1 Tax=Aliamphritea ceti TaxID=1524258 RepID=UPI0021C32D49|nr:type VI secretion system lipoprotein TssJ [Aliamphritea ceti]